MVCVNYLGTQYSEAKWPVGEREMFAACFSDPGWPAAHHQVESVCSGGQMPSWRTSTRNLLERALVTGGKGSALLLPGATKCSLSVACGQEMWRIMTGPQEGTEHTAADCRPASPQLHARDSSSLEARASGEGSLAGRFTEKPGLQEKGLH